MYKVLLADDEILDLEGMRTFIPWDDLGMKVVHSVNSGFAALKVMETEKIDILVTDVRMPNMSGLELTKKALEKWKDLRVIFVSGHQDFNYVKQALSLSACSYVLKPMDDNELIDSLIKLKYELDMEKKRHVTELAFKQMIPIVKNGYMLQLLEGSFDQNMLDVLNRDYGMSDFDWPGRVSVLEIDDLSWKLNLYTSNERHELLSDFFETVLSLCQKRNMKHVCKISNQRIALLFEKNMDFSVVRELIKQEKYPFTITVGMGANATGFAMLQDSYRQALEALDYKMFHGKGKLIEIEEVRSVVMEETKKLDIQLDTLLSAMSNYDLVTIHDEIEKLFKLAMNLNSKFSIHNFAMYIVMKLDSHLHTINEDLFLLLDIELKNLDILQQFETIDDIHSWLRMRVFEISEMLHNKKEKKNWKLVQDIIGYARERLHKNITLRDVANHFSFSPNYLGHLFKEETEKNFSEYMITLRMEKACELLKDSNQKIYEVADKVGYQYIPYFSRQFKETFGITPLEYRRKH